MTTTTSHNIPSLAQRLRDDEFVTAPGVYDLVSARVADRFGFKALYMSGYGVACASCNHRSVASYSFLTCSTSLSRAVIGRASPRWRLS